MQKNILITGEPKSGKSTLLQKLITNTPNRVGFITNEIRNDTGRVGFEIEAQSGKKAVLAHIDFKTEQKVSKYFVNTENLESLILEISNFENNNFLCAIGANHFGGN
jgi:nucleoside-triphosphatase THEP1